VLTVVPLTTNVASVFPFQVLITATVAGLPSDSKAQAEQLRSVAVERIGQRAGSLPVATLERLDDALRIHLSL